MKTSDIILAGCVRNARAQAGKMGYGMPLVNAEADRILVIGSASAMGDKLDKSRRKGRGGWWSDSCSTEYLKRTLIDHVSKGDMVDVMNLAAMIHARECAGI